MYKRQGLYGQIPGDLRSPLLGDSLAGFTYPLCRPEWEMVREELDHTCLLYTSFKVSEEEVSSSHSELKKERKVIEQLKILYKVIGCNREELSLIHIFHICF